MSEKKNENAHPKIEDAIHDVLSGDTLRNALDFVIFLRANGISPEWTAEAVWNVNYEGKGICVIYVDGAAQMPGPWTIWSDGDCDYSGEHEDFPMAEHLKEIAWANVNICASCGGSCSPGKRKTILGKEFDSVCTSTMAFTNPDAATLECAKKLVEMRKHTVLS